MDTVLDLLISLFLDILELCTNPSGDAISAKSGTADDLIP